MFRIRRFAEPASQETSQPAGLPASQPASQLATSLAGHAETMLCVAFGCRRGLNGAETNACVAFGDSTVLALHGFGVETSVFVMFGCSRAAKR